MTDTAGRPDVEVDLADVDLTDLDRFADGFPHDVFARLRADAPVWWHAPTADTPGRRGLLGGVPLRRRAGGGHRRRLVLLRRQRGAPDRWRHAHRRPPRRVRGRRAAEHAGRSPPPADPQARHPVGGARALAAMEPELRARAEQIVDDVVARGDTCDFLVEIAAELPLQAIARLLGVPAGRPPPAVRLGRDEPRSR